MAPPLLCPASKEAFAHFRAQTTTALTDLLGSSPFADPPQLSSRIMHVVDAGSYWRKKVRYGSEADDVVWAWLLVPKELDQSAPAIICLPGSFMTPNWGKDGPVGLGGTENWGDPESYGADLARLGYITLCPDYPCAGERTTPGLKAYDTAEFDRRFPQWTRVGMSVWDVGRAVDFLLMVPEVDALRIGCMGWSQGGQTSVLAAALEPRIAAVASVCGWSPLRELPAANVQNLCQSYNFPRLRPYVEKGAPLRFDLDHVAALIAPRPFLDVRGRSDRFFSNAAATEQGLAAIADVYEMVGAGERFCSLWYEGEHAYNATAAREVQAWFYRWLWASEARSIQ